MCCIFHFISMTNFLSNIPMQLRLQQKLEEIKLKLPWIERLDMTNDMAPLAPELVVQLEKHEQKRASLFAGNAKIKSFRPDEDPVLNDFKREMTFHRQAQAAVAEGIRRLHALKVPTKRPDDYFAEMAKSDDHMQKVRANLMAKQEGQAKSERIKQIREQRKMGKLIQRQARVQRDTEKRDMLEKLKKFRKGKLKNLDFLEDNRGSASSSGGGKRGPGDKRKARDNKFGFGGKKRGMKRNTKDSSMDGGERKNFGRGPANRGAGKGGNKGPASRLGKSKRVKAKAKGRK